MAVCNVVKTFRNMRILQISTRPYEFWSTMCNEGELLEKFNIQLTPIPMPELTDEMKKAKAEGTEVAKVVEYCRQNMEICVKDNELENVAALKVAMGNLIKKYGCQAAAIQCWNQLQSEIGIMPCAANALLNEEGIPGREFIKNNSNDFTKAIRDRRLQMSEQIEGRNAVLEAFRSGKCVDKLFVLDRCQDGPVRTIIREARKKDTIINFVQKERLDQLSETGAHQGVIAQVAAYEYSTVEDILNKAKEKGEAPFIFLLDDIEDPHNLGAIIRTANLAGAHGVIIPKRHAAGLTSTVAKTSAGALNYTPVAKVSNLGQTIEELKKEGMWFVCADMGGDLMYNLNLTGPMGVVIGNEGEGVSRLVKEKCDFVAAIPMKGDIDSLNASVAAGILAYEVVRQRMK